MRNALREALPRSAVRKLRRLLYWPLDTFDLLTGRRDALTPPRSLAPGYVQAHGWRAHGQAFLPVLTELGGLNPGDTVLDLGCGIGRIALPLTGYLGQEGRYEGLDVVPEAIRWCQRQISRRYPHFHFQVADIYHPRYNPGGSQAASNYRLPFPDATFDFVFLKSVFTHMLPAEMERYLQEVARVLKPGGRCLITYFLLDEAARAALNSGRARRQFPHDRGVYRVEDDEEPEAAVAYEVSFIRRCYQSAGLSLVEPIHQGSWRGIEDAPAAQDVVIAAKEGS